MGIGRGEDKTVGYLCRCGRSRDGYLEYFCHITHTYKCYLPSHPNFSEHIQNSNFILHNHKGKRKATGKKRERMASTLPLTLLSTLRLAVGTSCFVLPSFTCSTLFYTLPAHSLLAVRMVGCRDAALGALLYSARSAEARRYVVSLPLSFS